jgi:hypothetical protein
LVEVQVVVRPQIVAAFQVVRVVEPTLTPAMPHLVLAKRAKEILEVKEPEVPENPMVVVVEEVQAQPVQP